MLFLNKINRDNFVFFIDILLMVTLTYRHINKTSRIYVSNGTHMNKKKRIYERLLFKYLKKMRQKCLFEYQEIIILVVP